MFRWFSTLGLLVVSFCSVFAAERTLTVGGALVTLQDLSAEVDVYYSSMRLNRALNIWNVEVTVRNKGTRQLSGPFVLYVESSSGTTGFLNAEGTDAGHPYFDLGNFVSGSTLAPNQSSAPRTLSLGNSAGNTPILNAKVYGQATVTGFALALSRSLNEVGQPLTAVTVDEVGPLGQGTNLTEASSGVVTLGQSRGVHNWKFSRTGYLPVWRRQALETNEVAVLPNPRLTARSTNQVTLTPIAGGSLVATGVQVSFGPGTFAQNTVGTLTPLTGQTLPAFLPLGWSPLQAFWLEMGSAPAISGTASVVPWARVAASETVALVTWDEVSLTWDVLQTVPGNTNLTFSLPAAGAFAVVVADTGTFAPPAAVAGQPLQPTSSTFSLLANLEALGTVTPALSPASRVAEMVTAQAEVTVLNTSGPLPSGLVLRCDVSETYELADSSRRVLPRYENFIVAYQRPGDADAKTLTAKFPLRPMLLLGGDELKQANVRVDVLTPTPFNGGVLDDKGGQVTAGGIRVISPAGSLSNRFAIEMRLLEPTNFFGLAGSNIIRVFELSLGNLPAGKRLVTQISPQTSNSFFVLSRIISRSGLYGLEPVERFASDANGQVTSVEPVSGERLPGITGAGQFALLRVSTPQGLVKGVARNVQNLPIADLPVRIQGQPWLTFSGLNGAYKLISPTGAVEVVLTDLSTGDSSQSSHVLNDWQVGVDADASVGPVPPRVVAVSPAAGSTNVPLVGSVTITFSEPMNLGSVGSDGIVLLGQSNQPVASAISFNLKGTVATILPNEALAPTTVHTVVLSTNLTDLTGVQLTGQNTFTFTTRTDNLNRGLGAQLVSYEPTNGVVFMKGSQGMADSGVPVVLVNEISGQTTTVISKPDGSFEGDIRADVNDMLSAVFVNQNGTRNVIPVAKQIFSDGSVGLFNGGGILEAQNEDGKVELIVEPGSIPGKTKFKFEVLTRAQWPTFITNVPPGSPKVLGTMKLQAEGDQLLESMDVSFPVKVSDLGLPNGTDPTNATYVLTIPREVKDEETGQMITTYEIIDRMHYENGKLVTHSPPFFGILPLFNMPLFTAPLVMTVGTTMTVAGRVYAAEFDNTGKPRPETIRYLPGAVVTAVPPNSALPGLPGRLRPGTVFATAGGTNGSYAMMVEVSDTIAVAVNATHPRFFGVVPTSYLPAMTQGERFALGNYFRPLDVVFPVQNTQDFTDPTMHFSHFPERPAPGTNGVLKVVASDNISRPNVTVTALEAFSFEGQTNIPLQRVSLVQTNREDIGAVTRRETWLVSLPVAGRVVLQATASDEAGNQFTGSYSMIFGGAEPVLTNSIPAPDTNDVTGPRVITSTPTRNSSGFAPGQPIVLHFDEPIDRSILNDPAVITLFPGNLRPVLRLSEDQSELSLFFHGMAPGTNYTLTINSGLKDISGNRLDQDPTVEGNNSYVLSFKTADLPKATLPQLQYGGGAVIRGIYAYVLERNAAPLAGVNVYDLSRPDAPVKVAQMQISGGFPRDLALIPNYSFVRTNGGPVETKDLLAVVGGNVGVGNVQYLRVYDLSNPLDPELVTGFVLNSSPDVIVGRVQWDPPILAYMESGPIQTVNYINLQTMIIGEYLRLEDWGDGTPGSDLNGDGDYVDAGEQVPMPSKFSTDFAGKVYAFTLGDNNAFIQDFSIGRAGQYLGVISDQGKLLGTNGLPTNEIIFPAYRTLYSDGEFPEREVASYNFTNGVPKRLMTLLDFPLHMEDGQTRVADLALVSLRMNRGFEEGKTNHLIVLDVSEWSDPMLLAEVPIPAENGDAIYSVVQRQDGLLMAATSTDILLLDPAKFTLKAPANGVHPAIVGILPGAGDGMRTFDGNLAGLNITAFGQNNHVFQSAPTFQFISFPTNRPFLPSTVADTAVTNLETIFKGMTPVNDLWSARLRGETGVVASTISPPLGLTHYYVLVHAPGSAGPTIDLALESLNWAGQPLRKMGFLFPPVQAMAPASLSKLDQTPTADDAPTRASKAWRMSSNPASPYYNIYLSRPIALLGEEISKEELIDVQAELEREILWSGAFLRVSLDPSMEQNPVLGRFVGTVNENEKTHYPGVELLATSYPADYIQSPNPGPLVGGMSMVDALGSIGAHNSELRVETTDMALPGRRLPIEFRRFNGAQGLFDGPFGRGWDFNYNQRIVELNSRGMPQNAKLPLVARDTEENSEVAAKKDLLFYTGAGRIVLYKNAGTNAPSWVAADPLITEVLRWTNKVAQYFQPPEGVFNLMFKFKDGRYARLEPDGTQYWYNPAGKLTKIYDRYDKNALELVYNKRGELIRIYDDAHRPLDIGYWRLSNDPEKRPNIDQTTANTLVVGKIGRLLDYSNRDVLFYYDNTGLLERREGPLVETASPNGFTGRQVTRYSYSDTSDARRSGKSLTGVVAGDNSGTPLLAVADAGSRGRDTVTKLKVAAGDLQVQLGQNNSARALTSGNATASVTNPDKSSTSYKFDKFGRPTQTLLASTNGAPQTTTTEYYTNGLVKSITHPEGNKTEYVYDSQNPALRARGNVLSVTKYPGPRGGPVYQATTQYDLWYNLPSGLNTDFNTNHATIVLRPDHRDTDHVTKGGQIESFRPNEYGQIEEHKAIDGITRTWTYTPEGFVRTLTVGDLTTTYGYAPATGGRSDFTLRGLASSVTDPRGIITQSIYDERNQLVKSSRAGMDVTYAYDQSGNITEVRNTVDQDKTLVEQRTYNQVGFMLSKTVLDVEVEGMPSAIVTSYEPDDMKRVKRAVFPGGEVHEISYNHVGQAEAYTIGGTYKETYTYDANGNHTSTTIGVAKETYIYDGHDRLIKIVTPNGTAMEMSYDGNNNLLAKKVTDKDGTVLSEMTSTYDELDRPKTASRLRDSGVVQTSYSYNTSERTVSMTDGLGATAKTYYDLVGRIWKEETPTRQVVSVFDDNGNVTKRTITEAGRDYVEEFDYDDREQLKESTDFVGNKTTFTVGLDGRVKGIKDREGFNTTNQFTLLGEQASTFDANGVQTAFTYSSNRLVTSIRDRQNNALQTYYDSMGRVSRVVLPNHVETTYGNYDELNTPRLINMPRGIQIVAAYDAEGQLTNRVFTGLGAPRAEGYAYDGLHRLKSVSDPSGSVGFVYDKLGFTREFQYHYNFLSSTPSVTTLDFSILQEADNGGFRSKVTYPGGQVFVENKRDNTGRLLALVPNEGESIVLTNDYAGDNLLGSRSLGNSRVKLDVAYDGAKRVLGRRYTSNGKTLVDVRYAYDKNGAQLARQFVHRGGRADFFHYDPGYRLSRADVGVRPSVGAGEASRNVAGFAVPATVPGAWAPGLFARSMDFSDTDLLEGIALINPDNVSTPPMASTFGAGDELLFVSAIDGFNRTRDDVGNVTSTRLFIRIPGSAAPVPVAATNTYNYLNQLVKVEREDGVVVENEYNPSGLRIRRKVSGSPARCVPSDVAFIYDGGNLIEIRDLENAGNVLARFFYGDDGDELLAGDLNVGGSNLARHYFLTDVMKSVLAVTDANGSIVERVQYDAWGQPILESADAAAPRISRVTFQTNTLLVEFTEPVLPAFAGDSGLDQLATTYRSLNGLITVSSGGTAISGNLVFEENLAGRPFGTAFRFVPTQTLSGTADLSLAAAALQDEANNLNAATNITLTLAANGVVFTGPAAGSTAPTALARSTVNSPFLFHGQVFDYDTGLLYCRARFYDPATGMFLQRDPSGYVDGVNQYAGFANNPISLRDPTGHATPESMDNGQPQEKHSIGGYIVDSARQFVARTLNLGTATAEGIDLLNTKNVGSQGALDAMRGASLILEEAQVFMGAFSAMKFAAGSAVNLTRRAAGFVNQFRRSPQVPPAVRDYLVKQGFTQIEIDSIVPAMQKHGVSRLSIRSFNDKRFARQFGVNQGLPQKPATIKDKTGFDSTITKNGVTYVSDADILHVEIKGRPATLSEIQKFTKTANKNYTKLWNERGLGTRGVPANPPFQHGSHLGMAQAYDRKGKINSRYIAEVGHPGDSITIRIQGNGNVLAYDTPRWKTHQDVVRMGGVLRNKAIQQGVPGMSRPDSPLWPGKNWNQFQKDYQNEMLKHFYDPVSGQYDNGKLQRFFGGKP